MVNQANPSNPQHAVRIQNAGTAHTVSIFHDPAGGAGDPTAEAVDIVSTNEQDTALGVRGRETGKGTVKITHGKPAGPDANASALSIALEGAGTACQGIYIGNDAGNPTTGDLLHIRNGGPGTDLLRLTAPGRLELAAQGSEGGLVVGGDANALPRRSGLLATDGALQLTAAGANVSGRRWCAAHDSLVGHDHAESRRRAAGSDGLGGDLHERRPRPDVAADVRREQRRDAVGRDEPAGRRGLQERPVHERRSPAPPAASWARSSRAFSTSSACGRSRPAAPATSRACSASTRRPSPTVDAGWNVDNYSLAARRAARRQRARS